jgi:flagellar motility protein MotE (MotC chaperone)
VISVVDLLYVGLTLVCIGGALIAEELGEIDRQEREQRKIENAFERQRFAREVAEELRLQADLDEEFARQDAEVEP